jgi:hypothetical protein
MSEYGGHGPAGSEARGHEQSDVSMRPIVIGTIGLVVLIAVAAGSMRVLFDYFLAREMRHSPAANPLAAAEGERLPPQPRLLPQPSEQLRALRAREDEMLSTYDWVDRDKRVVRIPIERAMELIAQRGLPAVDTPGAAAQQAGKGVKEQ